MGEYVATATSKGQITLPVVLRRQRHPAAGDRAAFVVAEESGARLRRIEDDLEALQGIFPTPAGLSTDDFDDLVEEAMNGHADRVMRRMRATAD